MANKADQLPVWNSKKKRGSKPISDLTMSVQSGGTVDDPGGGPPQAHPVVNYVSSAQAGGRKSEKKR